MSLIFNISFGEDFYEDVELNIKKALDGIGDLLGDDFDA